MMLLLLMQMHELQNLNVYQIHEIQNNVMNQNYQQMRSQ